MAAGHAEASNAHVGLFTVCRNKAQVGIPEVSFAEGLTTIVCIAEVDGDGRSPPLYACDHFFLRFLFLFSFSRGAQALATKGGRLRKVSGGKGGVGTGVQLQSR